MRGTRHKRQILLFLLAIIAPAGVLIGLGGRLLYQDRELAGKRAADQHLAAVQQLRRELTARLDAIRLAEINRQIRPSHSETAQDAENAAVVFTGILKGDSLILPWEGSPAEYAGEFAKHLREGEALELGKKDYAAAAMEYRAALNADRSPAQTADARLHLARTLTNAGNPAEANRFYKIMLKDSAARDPEGVGYRFYAAERLLSAGENVEQVQDTLRKETRGGNRLTLPELYMIRTLLGPDATLSARIKEMEQTATLAKDIRRIAAQMEAGAAWVPYGKEPWLVTITSPQAGLPRLVLAVSPGRVAPPGVKLYSSRQDPSGEGLGAEFPGINLEWSGNPFPEGTRPAAFTPIWIAGLVLVLGMAIFAGYLLLRDVNRDYHMTEVRSQFVASVSHELKTPLTAIRMFAETLAMGRSRDERTRGEYLDTIVNESERLARLVDNVLDFSKIEQGKKIYRPRATRLEEVAASAVRAMQFPLSQQGFTLRVSIQDELPEIQADADAIQQAILNLLTNAMKYSGDSREIELRVTAGNGQAVIAVEDRGLGLTAEEQKHVFEKFYRAPTHASRLIAGTGLGLTLVAHIAQAHHGRVEVVSEPGAGSTFSILLPTGAAA